MEEDTKGAEFKLLRRHAPCTLEGTSYFLSEQGIHDNNTGRNSEFFVIKKQNVSVDGSPRGQSKSIWINLSHIKALADHMSKVLETR